MSATTGPKARRVFVFMNVSTPDLVEPARAAKTALESALKSYFGHEPDRERQTQVRVLVHGYQLQDQTEIDSVVYKYDCGDNGLVVSWSPGHGAPYLTGDPQALFRFVRQGLTEKATRPWRSMLVLWGHGQGVAGRLTPSRDALGNRARALPSHIDRPSLLNFGELPDQSIADGLRRELGRREDELNKSAHGCPEQTKEQRKWRPRIFDLVVFDSCLMATIEQAYEYRQVARFLLASQTFVGRPGLNLGSAVVEYLQVRRDDPRSNCERREPGPAGEASEPAPVVCRTAEPIASSTDPAVIDVAKNIVDLAGDLKSGADQLTLLRLERVPPRCQLRIHSLPTPPAEEGSKVGDLLEPEVLPTGTLLWLEKCVEEKFFELPADIALRVERPPDGARLLVESLPDGWKPSYAKDDDPEPWHPRGGDWIKFEELSDCVPLRVQTLPTFPASPVPEGTVLRLERKPGSDRHSALAREAARHLAIIADEARYAECAALKNNFDPTTTLWPLFDPAPGRAPSGQEDLSPEAFKRRPWLALLWAFAHLLRSAAGDRRENPRILAAFQHTRYLRVRQFLDLRDLARQVHLYSRYVPLQLVALELMRELEQDDDGPVVRWRALVSDKQRERMGGVSVYCPWFEARGYEEVDALVDHDSYEALDLNTTTCWSGFVLGPMYAQTHLATLARRRRRRQEVAEKLELLRLMKAACHGPWVDSDGVVIMDPKTSGMADLDPKTSGMADVDPKTSGMADLDPKTSDLADVDPKTSNLGEM